MKTFAVIFCLVITVSNLYPQFANSSITDEVHDQSEPTIVANPLNAYQVLAAWNDFREDDPAPGFAFSTDAGQTWEVNILEIPGYNGGFDPSVAFDRYGNAYYCCLPNSLRHLHVSSTSDFGVNWNYHLVDDASRNQDKPFMVVDNTQGEYDGNIYVSWIENFGGSEIRFAYSTDHGASFTVLNDPLFSASVGVELMPNVFFEEGLQGHFVHGPMPAVAPNGDVYVIAADVNSETNVGTFKIKVSTNGGEDFSDDPIIIPYTFTEGSYWMGQTDIRTYLSSVQIDPKTGNIYMVYPDLENSDYRIKFLRSTDGGSEWDIQTIAELGIGWQYFPWMSVDNDGRISILFMHCPFPPPSTEIYIDTYLTESYNEGFTFTPPLRISTQSFSPPDLGDHTHRHHYHGIINTISGDNYCVWTDYRSDTNADPYFSRVNTLERRSFDENATSYNNQRKFVKDSLGNFNIIFHSFGKVRFQVSTDNGNSWIGIDQLSSGDGICSNPSITTYDDYIFVTWQQYDGLVNGQHKYQIKGVYKNINGSSWQILHIYDPEVYYSSETDPLPVITAAENVDNNYTSDDGLPEVMIAFRKSDGIYHINLFYEDTPHDDIDEGYEQKGNLHKVSNTYSGYTNPSITVNGNGTIMLTCNSLSGNMYAFSTTGGSWYSYSSSIFSTASTEKYETSCVTSDGLDNFHIVWKGLNSNTNYTSILHKRISGSLDPIVTEFTYSTYDSYQPSSFGHLDQDGGVSVFWNTGTEIKRSINDGTRWDYSGFTLVPSIETDGNYVNSIDRADPDFPAYVYTGTEGPLYDINTVISSGLSKVTENGDTIRTYRKAYYYDEELGALLSLQIGNFRVTDYSGNELQIDPENFNENISLHNFNSALSELLSDVIPDGQLNKIIFDYNLEMKNLYQLRAGNSNNPRMSFVLKNRNNGNVLFSTDTVYLPLDTSLHNISGTQEMVLNNWNQNNNISLALKMQGIHRDCLNQSDNFNLVNTYFINSGSIGKKDNPVNNLPSPGYELSDNYPNPYNPTTTINYQLPQNGFVTLKVYDILGKEVAILVNEQKNQGRYSVNFNASHLASGVYIYQIRVNDYISSKKMLLLK